MLPIVLASVLCTHCVSSTIFFTGVGVPVVIKQEVKKTVTTTQVIEDYDDQINEKKSETNEEVILKEGNSDDVGIKEKSDLSEERELDSSKQESLSNSETIEVGNAEEKTEVKTDELEEKSENSSDDKSKETVSEVPDNSKILIEQNGNVILIKKEVKEIHNDDSKGNNIVIDIEFLENQQEEKGHC